MTRRNSATIKPFPVILKPMPDELLSSWLRRHIGFYGVSEATMLQHLMPDVRSLRALDLTLTTEQRDRTARFMRRDPLEIAAMTHGAIPEDATQLIGTGRPIQICAVCAQDHRQREADGVVLKSWVQAWRLRCPSCQSLLSDFDKSGCTKKDLDDFGFSSDIWQKAYKGEMIFNRYIQDEETMTPSPVEMLRLLLIPRRQAPSEVLRGYRLGRIVNELVPGFDDVVWSKKLKVRPRRNLLVPLAARVALLAGVATIIERPKAMLAHLRTATIGIHRERFDRAALPALPILRHVLNLTV